MTKIRFLRHFDTFPTFLHFLWQDTLSLHRSFFKTKRDRNLRFSPLQKGDNLFLVKCITRWIRPRTRLGLLPQTGEQVWQSSDMHSGDLLAYLSLNCFLMDYFHDAILFIFCQEIQFLKNNSCMTDGPTDLRTDGQTHPLIEMRKRIWKQ